VGADAEVETFFTGRLDEVPLVAYISLLIPSLVSFLVCSYLLAQIRAASRASELSCSYSLETRWMQRGNSSTFARLRPRSKMRIFGSGTPRLKRDFGYGYRIMPVSLC